jgi:aryl-alcohol dehydrogenase-like predicted oxidoreductase
MAQFALRWILMQDAVSCVIPGAKRPAQAKDNTAAADLPALSDSVMAKVREVYERLIKDSVHHLW